MKLAAAICMVLVCIIGSAHKTQGAVSCNQVANYLFPCVSYVTQGGNVPVDCCNGIRTLYGMAQTAADRQTVCRCLKSAIRGINYSNNNVNNAAALPAKCGLNLPYNISPSANCDSIN